MSLEATRRLERVLASILTVLLGIIAFMLMNGPSPTPSSAAIQVGGEAGERPTADAGDTTAIAESDSADDTNADELAITSTSDSTSTSGPTTTSTSTSTSEPTTTSSDSTSSSAATSTSTPPTDAPVTEAATTEPPTTGPPATTEEEEEEEEASPAGPSATTAPNTSEPGSQGTTSVLLYSETGLSRRTGTAAYVHESAPGAVTVLRQLAQGLGMDVTVASEAGSNQSAPYFSSCERLKEFDVLVFVNTAGDDILNNAEREAMQCWSANPDGAPGFIGIHGTAESLGDWDYFNDLVGARFNGHAREQDGDLHVNATEADHPSVADLASVATRSLEEWYVFRNGGSEREFNPWNPRNRPGLTVVLDVDEATYLARDYDYPLRGEESDRMYYSAEIPGQPGTLGRNHPVSWYQEFDDDPVFGNTRSFYTSLGHGGVPNGNRDAVWSGYADTYMQRHLTGALEWAAGR